MRQLALQLVYLLFETLLRNVQAFQLFAERGILFFQLLYKASAIIA